VAIPIRANFDKNKAARKGRGLGLMEKDYEFINTVAFSGWHTTTERERDGTAFEEFHGAAGGGSDAFTHWNFYMSEWMDGRTLNFVGTYRVETAGDTMTIRLFDGENSTAGPETVITATAAAESTLTLVLASPFRETHEIRLQVKMAAGTEKGFHINADEQKQYTYLTDP